MPNQTIQSHPMQDMPMRPIFRALLIPAAVLFAGCATASAQTPAPTSAAAPQIDHASSYYHYGLARMYEDQAVSNGRQDLATQAIE